MKQFGVLDFNLFVLLRLVKTVQGPGLLYGIREYVACLCENNADGWLDKTAFSVFCRKNYLKPQQL